MSPRVTIPLAFALAVAAVAAAIALLPDRYEPLPSSASAADELIRPAASRAGAPRLDSAATAAQVAVPAGSGAPLAAGTAVPAEPAGHDAPAATALSLTVQTTMASTGEPAANVTVVAVDTRTKQEHSATGDASGAVEFKQLASGLWRIEAAGAWIGSPCHVTLAPGGFASVTLDLMPAGTIEISAAAGTTLAGAAVVHTQAANASYRIDAVEGEAGCWSVVAPMGEFLVAAHAGSPARPVFASGKIGLPGERVAVQLAAVATGQVRFDLPLHNGAAQVLPLWLSVEVGETGYTVMEVTGRAELPPGTYAVSMASAAYRVPVTRFTVSAGIETAVAVPVVRGLTDEARALLAKCEAATVDMDDSDAPYSSVIDDLQRRTGLPIVVSEDARRHMEGRTVSIMMTEISTLDALELMCCVLGEDLVPWFADDGSAVEIAVRPHGSQPRGDRSRQFLFSVANDDGQPLEGATIEAVFETMDPTGVVIRREPQHASSGPSGEWQVECGAASMVELRVSAPGRATVSRRVSTTWPVRVVLGAEASTIDSSGPQTVFCEPDPEEDDRNGEQNDE